MYNSVCQIQDKIIAFIWICKWVFPTLVLCLGYDQYVFFFHDKFCHFLKPKNKEDLGRFCISSVNSTHFAKFLEILNPNYSGSFPLALFLKN